MILFRKEKKKKKKHGRWICWLCGFETNAESKRNTISTFLRKNPIFPITKLAVIGDPANPNHEIYFVSFKRDLDKYVEDNLISIDRCNEIWFESNNSRTKMS